MILFLVFVPLLALLAPVLAVILVQKNKKHKTEIDALTISNRVLSNQLSESQEKLPRPYVNSLSGKEKPPPDLALKSVTAT